MKNIKIILASLSFLLTFNACQESDNPIDQVLDGKTSGAILRTISVNNNTLNSSIPESFFSVTVEEQDEEDGALFQSVSVYAKFNDLTEDNGIYETDYVFVKDIDASTFTTSDNGLPIGDIVVTYGEIAPVLQLVNNENVFPGDSIIIQLRLNLTDGRVFTNTNSYDTIVGAGYFSSSFQYNTLIVCTPQFGDYTVIMHDAYGDGWQTTTQSGGPGLTIHIDDTEVQVGICTIWETPEYDCIPGNGSGDGTVGDSDIQAVVNVPEGTQQLTWELPGDAWGEISFQVYAPNGDLLFDRQPGGDVGLLPILLCL